MELSGQVPQEAGRVPHGGRLQRGEDETLVRPRGVCQSAWRRTDWTPIPTKRPGSQKPSTHSPRGRPSRTSAFLSEAGRTRTQRPGAINPKRKEGVGRGSHTRSPSQAEMEEEEGPLEGAREATLSHTGSLDRSWLSLGSEKRPSCCHGEPGSRGAGLGVGKGREGPAEAHPEAAEAGPGGNTRKAALTLREFSMLISQPSKCRNWASRTSRSATAWNERSPPARKASHSCPPSFHSVMKVPAGGERGQAGTLPSRRRLQRAGPRTSSTAEVTGNQAHGGRGRRGCETRNEGPDGEA